MLCCQLRRFESRWRGAQFRPPAPPVLSVVRCESRRERENEKIKLFDKALFVYDRGEKPMKDYEFNKENWMKREEKY